MRLLVHQPGEQLPAVSEHQRLREELHGVVRAVDPGMNWPRASSNPSTAVSAPVGSSSDASAAGRPCGSGDPRMPRIAAAAGSRRSLAAGADSSVCHPGLRPGHAGRLARPGDDDTSAVTGTSPVGPRPLPTPRRPGDGDPSASSGWSGTERSRQGGTASAR